MSKYGVFSGPYFPVFGLNTEIYEVNYSVFRYFSRSEGYIIDAWQGPINVSGMRPKSLPRKNLA